MKAMTKSGLRPISFKIRSSQIYQVLHICLRSALLLNKMSILGE